MSRSVGRNPSSGGGAGDMGEGGSAPIEENASGGCDSDGATESLSLDCTWDAAARNLQCTFSGTWGAPTNDFEGEGSLEGIFNVVAPEL